MTSTVANRYAAAPAGAASQTPLPAVPQLHLAGTVRGAPQPAAAPQKLLPSATLAHHTPRMPPWPHHVVSSAQAPAAAPPADSAATKVRSLMVAMGKAAGDGSQCITVRDILRHIDAVKAHAPQLLLDFPKIDQDGKGKVTAQQLEAHLGPEKRQELGRSELQEIWEVLKTGRVESQPNDRVFLADLARHYNFVERRLPEMVERFHEVDLDRSCSIERTEFDAFFGNGEAWLEARLANIIGLEELKEQIRTFYWATRLDRMRRRAGSFVSNDDAHVLMFKGNPGVGKTTIARLITGLLYKINVIPTETFVEVQRDQLVGDHIGATEKATEEAIAKACGGVLFVDEAYRLNSDVFGVEAINCLMKAMTVKGRVIILAGYPKQMDEFMSVNPGIKRRVTYEFTFPDYSPDDLAKIFENQVRSRGFELAMGVSTELIAGAIGRHTSEEQRVALNGSVGEHACRHAIFNLNKRQIDAVRAAAAREEEEPVPSVTLEMQDVEFGCSQVPDTSKLGSSSLPAPWASGKRAENGAKRGASGLLGREDV